MVADRIYPEFVEDLPSLSGKCIAITGTTSGTGFWAARAAIMKGASAVLLLNRKSERAVAADAELTRAAKTTQVISIECDLKSFASVKRAASAAANHAKGFGGLDALCCNAGIGQMPDVRTNDGYDLQMQVNHLSHAMLADELMPSLEAAAASRSESRVVFYSSGARFFPSTTVEDFGGKHFTKSDPGTLGGDCTTMQLLSMKSQNSVRYNHSKLAVATYAMALHESLAAQGSKVKSICAEPGSAVTSFVKNGFEVADGKKANSCALKLVEKVMSWTAQSAADGSCPLMAAGFGADAQSGDLFAPTNKASGMDVYATGLPTKVVAANQAVAGAKISEENTLNKKHQEVAWEMTRRAIGKV